MINQSEKNMLFNQKIYEISENLESGALSGMILLTELYELKNVLT